MAKTRLRERSVVDADFASEAEMEDRFTKHLNDYVHLNVPLAEDKDKFLGFDGTNFVWSMISGIIPDTTNNQGKILSNDGENTFWDTKSSEGWADTESPLSAGLASSKSSTPLWADTGNGFWGWHYGSNREDEALAEFHINHDIKVGGKMYPHVHWMPMSHDTGTVVWEIKYVYAKGYGQDEILTGTPNIIILKAEAKGVIGEHMITECVDSESFTIPEIDSIIRVKIRRLGTHPDDTFLGSVVALYSDIHYETISVNSIGRLPNFYEPTGEVL